jgi:hypothetical protein
MNIAAMTYNKKILSLFVAVNITVILVCGCINVDYVGQKFQRQNNDEDILFFNSNNDVPKDTYRVIGRANVTAPGSSTPEEIKGKILKQADECGADAVSIVDYKKIKIGEISTPAGTEYQGTSGVWNNTGARADGSPIAVDSFDKTVPLQKNKTSRYEIRSKALFLISNQRYQKYLQLAAEEKQKTRSMEQEDREVEQKKAIDSRELETLNVMSQLQADL